MSSVFFGRLLGFKRLKKPFVWFLSTFLDLLFLICSHFAVAIESSTANTEISSLFLAGLSSAMASLRRKAICVSLPLPCVHGESLGPSGTLFAAIRLTLCLHLALQILACGCDRVHTPRGSTLLMFRVTAYSGRRDRKECDFAKRAFSFSLTEYSRQCLNATRFGRSVFLRSAVLLADPRWQNHDVNQRFCSCPEEDSQ